MTSAAGHGRADMLRVATAGSVDDGKSTLIGGCCTTPSRSSTDQLEAVERASADQGDDYVNLALLTDGLRAEREQGITIDVAYRYFATPRRTFIIADTPGHVQYTRNMVTGASTADLAVVLVDARKGLLEQSRRHAFIATLLRVPHVVLAVNKMDLVDYAQPVFEAIHDEFVDFAAKLELPDLTVIPISALHGRQHRLPLPEHALVRGGLAAAPPGARARLQRPQPDRRAVPGAVRDPAAVRRAPDYRGYAGTVAGGVLRPGDEVMVLPSGFSTRIAAIDTFDGPVEEAFPPMSVTVRLADDAGRLPRRPHLPPAQRADGAAGRRCHGVLDERAASAAAAQARAQAHHPRRPRAGEGRALPPRREHPAPARGCRRAGAERRSAGCVLRTTAPLFADPYRRNRATGAFMLVDETSNATVAAGMILGPAGGPA